MSNEDLSRLNKLIAAAKGYKLTADEFRQQQIGWIVGNTDESLDLTRAQAEALLAD